MQRLSPVFISGLAIAMAIATPTHAQNTEASPEIDPAAEPPRCVRLVNVNGYFTIDDEHLVLNGGASRHYLVTMWTSCPSLRFGTQVATTFGRYERVCRPFIEYVVDRDGYRCPIKQVEEVDSPDAARALIAARAELEAAAESSDE